MRSVICFGILFTLWLVPWKDATWAGNNAGGRALLTWTHSDPPIIRPECNPDLPCISDLPSLPQPPVFPLYLQLDGAPDIRQLAVTINWTPADSLGGCYGLVSAVSNKLDCGWGSAVPPSGGFGPDNIYTWSIVFPPGSSKHCVTYWVSGACGTPPPADFCLGQVKTRDSAGAIDTLALVGKATILGGTGSACPAPATS